MNFVLNKFFWSWIKWNCSYLSLCGVFMGLAFLMRFRFAWSAWDVQAICIVSAVSDVIFPAVPSTLIFSAALGFDHHEEEVSSLCNTADTSLQVRRLSVLWIACFNPFICVLSRQTWIVSPPKRGQLGCRLLGKYPIILHCSETPGFLVGGIKNNRSFSSKTLVGIWTTSVICQHFKYPPFPHLEWVTSIPK